MPIEPDVVYFGPLAYADHAPTRREQVEPRRSSELRLARAVRMHHPQLVSGCAMKHDSEAVGRPGGRQVLLAIRGEPRGRGIRDRVHDADLEGPETHGVFGPILHANRMRVPSGDHAGPRFSIPSSVNCSWPVPSAFITKICAGVTVVDGSLI